MKAGLQLSGVNYQVAGISPEAIVQSSQDTSGLLSLVHTRKVPVSKKREVSIAFVLNNEQRQIGAVLDFISVIRHQPAVFPEVDCLRSIPRVEMLPWFEMADRHAEKRKVKVPYVHCLCLPVLGSRFFTARNEELVPMFHFHRAYGRNGFVLMPRSKLETIHPAWMIPVVAKSS